MQLEVVFVEYIKTAGINPYNWFLFRRENVCTES